MVDLLFRIINRLFVYLIKAGENDSLKNSFNKKYTPLVEIKDFNALITNKPICHQPIKHK